MQLQIWVLILIDSALQGHPYTQQSYLKILLLPLEKTHISEFDDSYVFLKDPLDYVKNTLVQHLERTALAHEKFWRYMVFAGRRQRVLRREPQSHSDTSPHRKTQMHMGTVLVLTSWMSSLSSPSELRAVQLKTA